MTQLLLPYKEDMIKTDFCKDCGIYVHSDEQFVYNYKQKDEIFPLCKDCFLERYKKDKF